jgi:lysozyme
VNRIQVAALSLSATALVGLAAHEGYVEKAYQDIVGVWTIGFGTTEGVRPGQTIDPVKALQRALTDAQKFEGALKECVHVPLHQHEYDSLVAFSYNVGSGAFCRSTLVRKLNAGDYEGACKELLRWNRAGGKVVRGLVNRREQEYKLCMGGAK